LGVGLQVFLATDVLKILVVDSEVGGEHRRGEFVAVGAVADEGADIAWAMGWLEVWRWC
jgi:hypothetical protein